MTLAQLLVCIALLVGMTVRSVASDEPCIPESRCQYSVKDFKGTYPPEKERTYWSCYDRASKITIGCNFIRGDNIKKFSHVFRKHEEDLDTYCNRFCTFGEIMGSRTHLDLPCYYKCKEKGYR